MRRWLAGVAVLAALGLGACSSSSTSTSTKDLPSKDSSSESASSTTTTSKTSSTQVKVATDGTLFTDPDGAFTMRVGATWTPTTSSAAQAWFLTAPVAGVFTPNVNVILSSAVRAESDSRILESLRKEVTDAFTDTVIIRSGTVRLPSGSKVYELEYTANISGTDAHLYQVVSVGTIQTAIASLTTAPDQFNTYFPTVRPYMLTLKAA